MLTSLFSIPPRPHAVPAPNRWCPCSAPLTSCAPLSPLEQRLIHTPAAAALPPRPPPHSWLAMLARSAAVQGELFKAPGGTAGVSPGAAAAGGSGALVPAGSDSTSSASGVHPLSEFGLRMVEAVHLVLHQALLFSLLTSPQVEERELALARSSSSTGGSSTTTWPDRRLLETVQVGASWVCRASCCACCACCGVRTYAVQVTALPGTADCRHR